MLAVLINCIAIVIGSLIGLLVGKHVKEGFKEIVFACCGLITIVMGIQMSIATSNALVLLLGVVVTLMFRDLDYSRVENVQFEDDEYYYYVTAVPKIRIAEEEKRVKRITGES